jgi:MFS family permease
MEQASDKTVEAKPARAVESGWASTFHALQYPNFRILWFTSGLVAGGVWLQQVTLGWLAYDLTKDALQVGAILGVRSAPMLLAPMTGVLVDRMDRRKLLMAAQVLVTTLVFGFSALLFLDLVRVWHLYVFAVLFGLLWAVNNPVRQTLVANSVPREALMNATALNSVAFNSMRMIGPAVGGLLILLVGPALNFFLQGCLFAGVILMLLRYRTEYGTGETALARKTSPVRNLVEGFRYVLSDRLTLLFIAMSFVVTITLLGTVFNMMPVFVPEVLGDQDGALLGYIMTALGVGGVVGTIVMARFSAFPQKGVQSLGAFSAAALCVVAVALVRNFWAAAAILALYQVFAQAVMTTNMTVVQAMTPDRLRGRVVGVYQMEIGLMPVGGVIGGAIANRWGVDISFLVAGLAGCATVVLMATLAPSIRRLRL